MKRKLLFFINLLLIIFIIVTINFLNPQDNIVHNILFKENNNIEDNYDVEQVKLFAITLEAQEEYIENTKTTPLTCKINVDRITRLIYMDGDEKLGEKKLFIKNQLVN